jgi:hypothetical protein
MTKGIVTLIYIGILLMSFSANAEKYVVVGMGKSHYKLNPLIWQDSVNGYGNKRDLTPPTQFIGIGWDRGKHDLELSFHYFGDMQSHSLWGDPDDSICPTCQATTLGVQGGDVTGLSFSYIPKWRFKKGNIHARLGVIYYRATWYGRFFVANSGSHDRDFFSQVDLETKQFGGLVGAGVSLGNWSLDYTLYPGMSVEGKNRQLGGGGGYDEVSTLTFSYRVPLGG